MSITIKNLTKWYIPTSDVAIDAHVVYKNFSLDIVEGEVTVIVGPNGVGKSTLLKIIAGLILPDTGSVEFANNGVLYYSNEEGTNMPKVATLVFQQYEKSLPPWQTVERALKWGYSGSSEDYPGIMAPILETIGLKQGWKCEDDWRKKLPHELSGGQMQKVVVARALIKNPKLLLMDEPFGSLDAGSRYDLEMHLIKEKIAQRNLTILFATHDLEEAVFLANKIVVLGGKPVQVCGEISVTTNLNERTPAFKESPEFCALRKSVRELLERAST